MSMSNRELQRRTDLALSQLSSNGGLLDPMQANAFIDLIQEQPSLLRSVRMVRMNAPQMKINRLGFGTRIMKAAPQGSPPYAADDGTNDRYLLAADRSAPTTSQITLTTKEVMAEVHIPYEVLEDNIERGGFEEHIMRLIAERVAIDMEDWAINADTGSGDDFLALADGYLKQMTSHVVNNASAGITPDLFQAGMLAMPQKYLRNLSQLRQYITVADNINYRANVAKRATGYGDSALNNTGELTAYGVTTESLALLPASTGFFTFPQNLIMGVQRNVMVETDKDIRARQIIIVVTMRVDVKIDLEDATVKYTNI
jgi:HK97 family phage major capsid protein